MIVNLFIFLTCHFIINIPLQTGFIYSCVRAANILSCMICFFYITFVYFFPITILLAIIGIYDINTIFIFTAYIFILDCVRAVGSELLYQKQKK